MFSLILAFYCIELAFEKIKDVYFLFLVFFTFLTFIKGDGNAFQKNRRFFDNLPKIFKYQIFNLVSPKVREFFDLVKGVRRFDSPKVLVSFANLTKGEEFFNLNSTNFLTKIFEYLPSTFVTTN